MMSRRVLAIAAAVLLVCGCASRRAFVAPLAGASDPYAAPPEVRAVHGLATLEIDAVLDAATGLPALAYRGVPGVIPTIRVHPGDTIALTLRNDMSPQAGAPNAINMHFHGLHVSPAMGQDDALMTLARRGEVLRYRVVIPRDHEPGLYWYHPHSHGESFRQVSAGLSGAIVVEGMQQHLPALAGMRERLVILRDVPSNGAIVDDDMPMNGMAAAPAGHVSARPATNANDPCRSEKGMWTTVNGQPFASIGIAAGERQFFRVVNASAGRYYDLSADGSPLRVVAYDGVPLDALPGNPTTRTVQHLVIPPAGRAEFVITGTGRAGVLRSACFDSGKTGDPDPPAILANLVPTPNAVASDDSASTARNDNFTVGAPLPRNFFGVRLPAPAAHRTIRFSEDSDGFYLNGKAYDMDGPPAIVARSGTVERWTLVNATDEVHDFHIHQVHFVVDSVRGARPKDREWLDTVNLDPHSSTDVTIDFRDPIVRGTFLYHCHILDHEDQGMMAKITVI